jgi:poly-gamma-glutamate synthesis protein (capsule biosynthesis protein)
MESALGDVGEPEPKSYTFQAPPVAAEAMARAGFDVMSLANNHALDFGRESLLQGIELLEAQGIAPIGAGANAAAAHAPFVTEVNGISVAFLGYMDVPKEWHGYEMDAWTATAEMAGVAWGNPDEIRADVMAVRDGVDVVVVVLHSGYEYIEEPSEEQAAAVQAAIDAGAALVIGHHAHIVQGVGFGADGQVAAYGLGNFAFDIEGEAGNVMLGVWLDGDGVRMVELMPAIVQYGGYPRLATPEEGRVIRERIYFLSQFLSLE